MPVPQPPVNRPRPGEVTAVRGVRPEEKRLAMPSPEALRIPVAMPSPEALQITAPSR
jgi:hypothetical protein